MVDIVTLRDHVAGHDDYDGFGTASVHGAEGLAHPTGLRAWLLATFPESTQPDDSLLTALTHVIADNGVDIILFFLFAALMFILLVACRLGWRCFRHPLVKKSE